MSAIGRINASIRRPLQRLIQDGFRRGKADGGDGGEGGQGDEEAGVSAARAASGVETASRDRPQRLEGGGKALVGCRREAAPAREGRGAAATRGVPGRAAGGRGAAGGNARRGTGW